MRTWGVNRNDYIFALSRWFFLIVISLSTSVYVYPQSLDQKYWEMYEQSEDLDRQIVSLLGQENFEDALPLALKQLEVTKQLCLVSNYDYPPSYMILGLIYRHLGMYSEAQGVNEECLNLLRNENKSSWTYANIAEVTRELAMALYCNDQIEKALEYIDESLLLRETLCGRESNDYASALEIQSLCYSEKGLYREAYENAKQVLQIRQVSPDAEPKEIARAIKELAYAAYKLGDYDQAILRGEEALGAYLQAGVDTLSWDFALTLSQISDFYASKGDIPRAIENEEKVLKIYEHVLSGTSHVNYASALNKLANYHEGLYNYIDAIRYATEALEIRKQVGAPPTSLAKSCNVIANILTDLGKYQDAIVLCEQAIEFLERSQCGTENHEYKSAINTMAVNYMNLRSFDKAVELWEDLLNSDGIGEDESFYEVILSNIGTCYARWGKFKEALSYKTSALQELKRIEGGESYNYSLSLMDIADIYYDAGEYDELTSYAIKASSLIKDYILKVFKFLPAYQRACLWTVVDKLWYERNIHKYSYTLSRPSLYKSCYNCVLLSKGLLLNSEIEFAKLIEESGDSLALEMYDNLRSLRGRVNKLQESYVSADPVKLLSITALVDSLNVEADRVEKELVRCNVYGDYTKNLAITCDQVQEKLTDKDIAVEFVSFPLNADSTMYIAYALRKGWEYPRMIPLFEERQLLSVQERYTTDSISSLVWKPLGEVMQGVENVYFAPSGELYNIAIESIPTHEDGGQTLVGEHRNYYRLSSTRELALRKEESRWDEAAVYGGLQYDMSVKGMIEEDGKYDKTAGQKRGDSTPSYYVVREDSIGRGYRDHAQGLKYLEGTKREADSITHYLEQKSVDARLFTDSKGTETSFKALGGKKTSIIHIGTHGFFNDREKEYKEDKLQLLSMDDQSRVVEDDALTRSGLYFAGADNVILNGQSAVPDSIDDGRLTAAEIAQLDLRGLDMVVLSACQTGLGEITGDGVFGLQRGFKKAGAQTIVMSLWNVNDEATTEFMTTFFENINIEDGRPTNKYEAFKTAQKELRKNKDKYSDKNCWAAFVMLDGID